MKNIIIGGTVRSGKSTLANLLVKRFKYSKCESDTIVNAFNNVFPELGITHKNPIGAREVYEPFLFEILNGFCKDLKHEQIVTVFPGSQFLPENIARYEKKDKYIVIFLGLDGVTPQELLIKIRQMDKEHDWTFKRSDEWLLTFCDNVIKESNLIKEKCKEYGFYYFNTFNDRDEVLNIICNLIDREQQTLN